MRRLIETTLMLLLSGIALGTMEQAADVIPVIITVIVLANLTLFSPLKYIEYVTAAVFLTLYFFQPVTGVFSPLMGYALFQRRPWLALVPLAAILPIHFSTLVLFILAIWLAWQAQYCEMQEKRYIAMRDDYAQNEILQSRIQQEEALSHEKNLEIAVLKERNRISREIHDSVGHTISGAILQLEAMKITADAAQKERLAKVSDSMARGMEEIRASLHNLQSDSISLKAELEALTEPMKASYQITITMQMDEAVPLEVKRAIRNLVREALTNIRKHSDATEIRIVLRELPRHYTAGVKDNGSETKRQDGLGLSTQEEAARSLGGVFSSGWSDGFYVHMAIPKDDERLAGQAERPDPVMLHFTKRQGGNGNESDHS